MLLIDRGRLASLAGLVLGLGLLGPTPVPASFIFATGQALIPGSAGHDDLRENRIFRIDTTTGLATPSSPPTTGLPAALASTPDGLPLGYSGGQVLRIDPSTGTTTPIGPATDLNSTSFDVISDGRGFILPFNSANQTQQLHGINLANGAVTSIGSASAIGDAIDAAAGTAPGTADPFIIGLGSVGGTLYGVDLDTNSLLALDPDSGAASVVGTPGAVGRANGGGYTGFAAMTGVDEDSDGDFDTLYGAVNFDPAGGRLGGLARFNLSDGTWTLVGSNPGLIYFGFGASAVPEPSSFALLAAGVAGLRILLRLGKPARA